MSYTVNEFNVKSTDNIHTLKGKIYLPDGEIKGHFHIVHGMTEHIGRYDLFMSKIAEAGYICYGFDNLGHGNTADGESELGFIASNGGYRYLLDDVIEFHNAVKEKYPTESYVLMGHSMGSFIARLVAEKYGDKISSLIICGTGGPQAAAPVGIGITMLLKKIYGERHCSEFLQKLIFGAYNIGFEGISQYDWLTKDRAVIEKYEQDKFCTFRFTVSAMEDLLKLTVLSNRSAWFNNLRKDLPILLISGESDPVGNRGRGVKKVFKKLLGAEVNDVNMYLYPDCRHEILNDSCKQEVTSDIIEFIANE